MHKYQTFINRFLYYSIGILIIIAFLSSCSKDDVYSDIEIPQIKNNSLPSKAPNEPIKILFIGSSWMRDTWWYCNKVFQESEIPHTLGAFYYAGAGFHHWTHIFNNNIETEFFYSQNGSEWQKTNKTLEDGIKLESWDIIVLQQSAHYSFHWESYQPHLNNFVKIVSSLSSNNSVCFAINHTWTPAFFSSYISSFGFSDQSSMHGASVYAVKQAMKESGIDIIIPCGVAVDELRKSSLQNEKDLTDDGLHLDIGIGRYLTACTVFETLIKPIYGVSIYGNGFRINDGTPVVDENAEIIQNCAIEAISHPFEYR